jgi:hypothetical protein
MRQGWRWGAIHRKWAVPCPWLWMASSGQRLWRASRSSSVPMRFHPMASSVRRLGRSWSRHRAAGACPTRSHSLHSGCHNQAYSRERATVRVSAGRDYDRNIRRRTLCLPSETAYGTASVVGIRQLHPAVVRARGQAPLAKRQGCATAGVICLAVPPVSQELPPG